MYVLTIDDDSYGYQKKTAFTLSEKMYSVFQPVEKKYPGFPADEKKDGLNKNNPGPPEIQMVRPLK